MLVPRAGAGAADLRASLARLDAAAAATDHVALAPAARRAALAQVDRGGARAIVVPLRIDVPETQSPDVGDRTCATASASATPAGGPVATHLVGQGALWAGMQDVSKEDLAQAESTGLPIVLLILLAVFGSLAAAALPLGLGVDRGDDHRRGDLLALAPVRDVGLRDATWRR